jgi:gluconate kinase
MPVGLLDSQLRVLESPGNEELDIIELDLGSPIETLVQDAVDALQRTTHQRASRRRFRKVTRARFER